MASQILATRSLRSATYTNGDCARQVTQADSKAAIQADVAQVVAALVVRAELSEPFRLQLFETREETMKLSFGR